MTRLLWRFFFQAAFLDKYKKHAERRVLTEKTWTTCFRSHVYVTFCVSPLCATFVFHLCVPPLRSCVPPLWSTFVRHLCAPPLCATFVCHLWLVSRKYRLGKPPPGGVCCLECYLHTSDRSRPRSCRSLPRRYDMLLCRICMVKIQRRDHVLQRRDHVLGHVDCSAPTRQHEAK